MFNTLLNRLLHKGKAAPPAPIVIAAPAASTNPARRPIVERAPAAAPIGVGARRPLVSAQGTLAGFEFHAGALDPRRLRGSEDAAVAAAYARNVLGAMRLCTSQGLAALAELPVAWLARCTDDKTFGSGMHLLLRIDPTHDAPAAVIETTKRLRAAGASVGWDPFASESMALAEAGKPDFMPLQAPAARESAQAWRGAIGAATERCPGVPVLILDLPGVETLEAVLGPGVLMAACNLAAVQAPAKVQALPAQAQRLLRLLDRLLHDDENAAVVDEIKADAALSLRLLHYLNSAGASPGRELDSIEQAVLVLGRDKLYHWLAQMLVRMSPPRPASEALQALALARARMLESLGRAEGVQSPGSLYLLGLASMLPPLLQCSLADAGQALCLPPSAMQALESKAGPWGAHLLLLDALEANDIAAAAALAAPFGGLDAVFARWTEAWRPR